MNFGKHLEIVIDTFDQARLDRVDDLDASRPIVWYLVVIGICVAIGVIGWGIFG